MSLIFLSVLITLAVIGLVVRGWLAAHQKQVRMRRLRTWATRSATLEPVLQQWIQQMPTAQLEVLLDLLHGYCVSLKWELDWLFAPQIKNAPALHTAVADSVTAYVRAILLSLQMAEDVHAYHVYLRLDRNPHARRQRALVQQLYAQLYDQRATPIGQGVLHRFSRAASTRNEQIAAIRQAFAQDPKHTMAVLKELLAPTNAASIPHASPKSAPSVHIRPIEARG